MSSYSSIVFLFLSFASIVSFAFFFLSCHRQRRGCQFATLIRYVHSGLTHQVPGGGCGDSDVDSGSGSGTDCPAAKCQASGHQVSDDHKSIDAFPSKF
jgi:hypothetical protein